MSLLTDLAEAERENVHARSCEACDTLAAAPENARPQVAQALAGTIGAQKLSEILTRNGYPTGRRAIQRHRREGHDTP